MVSTPYPRPAPVGPSVLLDGRELRRRIAALHDRVDVVLVGAVAVLCTLGAVLVWSATKGRGRLVGSDPLAFLKKDLLNVVIGVVLLLVVTFVDRTWLRSRAVVLYLLALGGLVAVLLPGIGSTINGAHSWLVLPAGFQVEPAEFVKLALVVGLAELLSQANGTDRPDGPTAKEAGACLALTAVPAALIMLQPDLGMTIVMGVITLAALALAGVRASWLVGLVLTVALLVALVLSSGLLAKYQVDRLTNFADPHANVTTSGYNVQEAKTALGSGRLLGEGIGNGRATVGGFVPEQQTDFVFTVAGEELGFVGSAGLVLVLGVLLLRAVSITARATDVYGRVVAGSITAWWAFQAFVNIGMTLGIMPVTGLPLPFVSYGGTVMFVNLMAVGLLLDVRRASRRRR